MHACGNAGKGCKQQEAEWPACGAKELRRLARRVCLGPIRACLNAVMGDAWIIILCMRGGCKLGN